MSQRPGVGLPGTVTMREAEQLAAEAENAGASSVWVTDVRREPYLGAAAALRGTSHVTVGTDVAVAFSRSPAVTAQAAWDLAGYGGGRFVLGLGSQVGPTLLSRFGVEADRPAARLRDYVLAVRACWDAYRSGRGRYEGKFYAISQPVFSPGADDPWPAIPLYVAGVNPVMTAVAGEVADGFAAHMFCTPTYLDQVLRPALARGAARANRAAPPVLLPLVVGRDQSELDAARSGLETEADAILAAIADRRRTEAARIIEERCLDQLGVAVIDELAERIHLWGAHADAIGLTVPWYGLDAAAQVALFREVLQALQRI